MPEDVNAVRLVGRLSAAPTGKVLPSGDEIVGFRLVVGRPAAVRRRRPGGPAVDTVDCVVWRAALRRAALGWPVGATLEVDGSLRRRFFRTPAGTGSRCEVEVDRARVARAARDG